MGYGMRFSGKFEKEKKGRKKEKRKLENKKDICQPNGLEMSDLHVVFRSGRPPHQSGWLLYLCVITLTAQETDIDSRRD